MVIQAKLSHPSSSFSSSLPLNIKKKSHLGMKPSSFPVHP
jgi:hypothetical protein